MANQKIPSYLNAEQRQAFMEIPSDLSERDLAVFASLAVAHPHIGIGGEIPKALLLW